MPVAPLLRPLALVAALLPAAAQAQTVLIAEPIQLYAGPAPDFPILMTLSPGMEARLFGCLPDYQWCDVRLSFGARGWVFAGGLYYPWMGNSVPILQYGPTLGIPLISFFIGDYWGAHYRRQPWYGERERWQERWRERPPPVAPMYPPRAVPPPSGWSQPYPPPRIERGRERERDWDRNQERTHERDWRHEQHRQEDFGERERPRDRNPQPRQEVMPPQASPRNAMPAPNPGWSGGMPNTPPRQEQHATPRQEPPRAFSPMPARPEPPRDAGPPPRQERGTGHDRGPRPEGPREERQGNR